MRLISGILASRATTLAPILAAIPNNVRTNHLRRVGLARVLACSPRLSAKVLQLGRRRGQMGVDHFRIRGLGRRSRKRACGERVTTPIVESPLLRMTKRRAFLRALSQNRASASRVSLCYGL
jgi:hypothetical protein